MNEIETSRLVELARAGDREAFNTLTLRFERTVFAVAVRHLRNQADAAEVTQDVFLTALRKLHQLTDDSRFAGWLLRIAIRLSINKAVRRPKDQAGASDALAVLASRSADPVETSQEHESAEQLRAGLRKLKKLDRDTLVAFYFEGRSLQEISDDLSTPVGTIKRRLHTARLRLRDTLGKLSAVG